MVAVVVRGEALSSFVLKLNDGITNQWRERRYPALHWVGLLCTV